MYLDRNDFIVLDGNQGEWVSSSFLEWQIPNYYFKHLEKNDDIYVSLYRAQFLDPSAITAPAFQNAEIITNLPLQNQSNTSSEFVLDIIDIVTDYDNNSLTPVNYSDKKEFFKVSQFNSIRIGVKHDGAYLDMSGAEKANTKFIIKIVYHKRHHEHNI